MGVTSASASREMECASTSPPRCCTCLHAALRSAGRSGSITVPPVHRTNRVRCRYGAPAAALGSTGARRRRAPTARGSDVAVRAPSGCGVRRRQRNALGRRGGAPRRRQRRAPPAPRFARNRSTSPLAGHSVRPRQRPPAIGALGWSGRLRQREPAACAANRWPCNCCGRHRRGVHRRRRRACSTTICSVLVVAQT